MGDGYEREVLNQACSLPFSIGSLAKWICKKKWTKKAWARKG
jgi:hypothetical protein